MWRTWRNAISRLTQEDGKLRPWLGKLIKVPADRRYAWMHDDEWVYEEKDNEDIVRYKIIVKRQRTAEFARLTLPIKGKIFYLCPNSPTKRQHHPDARKSKNPET